MFASQQSGIQFNYYNNISKLQIVNVTQYAYLYLDHLDMYQQRGRGLSNRVFIFL